MISYYSLSHLLTTTCLLFADVFLGFGAIVGRFGDVCLEVFGEVLGVDLKVKTQGPNPEKL